MTNVVMLSQWFLGLLLILSSLGVILASKPIYSSLSFLLTLMTLAILYLELDAQFISVMQILIYAGAILVIFMFVVILFQDAYKKISEYQSRSYPPLLYFSMVLFILSFIFLGYQMIGIVHSKVAIPEDFGTTRSLGYALYIDFFFPFEAVIVVFLIAMVGALYIGKKGR